MRKYCLTCEHNVEISQADLYGANKAYGSGDIFDWCEVYHEPVDRIMQLEPELDDCEEWEEKE